MHRNAWLKLVTVFMAGVLGPAAVDTVAAGSFQRPISPWDKATLQNTASGSAARLLSLYMVSSNI